MKIAMGSDHAGFLLKEDIKEFVEEHGHRVIDFGCDSDSVSVDYPDFGFPAAESVAKKECDAGILVCGSGHGMTITANKVKGIRATLCQDVISARFARSHNDANILVLGERLTTPLVAREIVRIWLDTSFDGGRHKRRIDRISEYEK